MRMDALQRDVLVVLAVLGVGFSLVQTLWLWARRIVRRQRLALRRTRAAQGEAEAEWLLARAGYRVLERQVHGCWQVRIDGEERAVELRADFIVARGGRRYVAEVKNGRLLLGELRQSEESASGGSPANCIPCNQKKPGNRENLA